MFKHKCHLVLYKFGDSKHFQLAQYPFFDEESDVQVENKEFWGPDAKNEEELPPKFYVLIRGLYVLIVV